MALKTHDSKKENSPNGEKKIISLPTGKAESGKAEPSSDEKIIPLPTGKAEPSSGEKIIPLPTGKAEPSSGEKIIPLPTGKAESGKAEPAITVEEKPEDLKEHNKLQEAIDRIDVWISTAVENGLFTKNKVTYNSMINNLKSARSNLKEGNLIECDYKLALVLDQYSDAANNTSRRWKLFNTYAIDVWIYLIGFLAVVFIFYFNGLNSILKSPPFAESAIHAATWGIIGAILRGLWFLKEGVGERKYRKTWRILYYSYPFLGGIFGTLTYLIVFAGLITFSGTEQSAESAVSGLTNSTVSGGTNSTVSGGTDSNSRSLLFIPIAALAGFNWEWFMLIFNRIAEIITVTKERSTEKIQT